jgi:hypothetical protein
MEFKISTLFMKNKWCLSSRTTQNTTSKHKICNIFPLILREMDGDKTRLGRWNSKFLRYLWRTSDSSHPEAHKTRIWNIKIAPFFLLSSEKRCWENAYWTSDNAENDHFFQYVGIQNFEVIYKELVMAHIQNHTKHDFET